MKYIIVVGVTLLVFAVSVRGLGPVNAVGEAVGGVIGGTWGAIVPGGANNAAIKGAGGPGCDYKSQAKGPVNKVVSGAGGIIGSTWGAVVPDSVRQGSIKAAKTTGRC